MKKKILTITIIVTLGLGISLSAALADGATVEIHRSVCSGGGGTVGGGEVSLSGTLGQPFVGSSGGGNVVLQSGFWPGLVGAAQYLCYLPLILK